MNASIFLFPHRVWLLRAPQGSLLSEPSPARGCTSWRLNSREATTWLYETEEVRLHLVCLLFFFSVFLLFWVFMRQLHLSSSGSSDPYVKFKLGGKEVFRSKTIHKNLNPVWEEKTTLIVDTLSEPLYVKVKAWTHTKLFHLHS